MFFGTQISIYLPLACASDSSLQSTFHVLYLAIKRKIKQLTTKCMSKSWNTYKQMALLLISLILRQKKDKWRKQLCVLNRQLYKVTFYWKSVAHTWVSKWATTCICTLAWAVLRSSNAWSLSKWLGGNINVSQRF